jgi:hypothetical protein
MEAYTNKPGLLKAAKAMPLEKALLAKGEELRTPEKGDVKMIYCTAVGDGPRSLEPSEALIDTATGFPLEAKLQKWQQTLGGTTGGTCPVKLSMPIVATVAVAAAAFMFLLKKGS